MNVYLESLGCRLNQSEIETLARQFVTVGYTLVDNPRLADVCVLNTCAVTAKAGRKSRRRVRALADAQPQARIAVIGCYATLAPRRCSNLPNVDWVVSNTEKDRLVQVVAPADSSPCPPESSPGLLRRGEWGVKVRTRAFVKVQDGCDNHCTYCIVRSLRGRARSRFVPRVVDEVQSLVQAGCQEVVLTGVNLGSYGRDLGDENGLRALVGALLDRTDLPRLRLSSLEPWDLDENFFELWENPRLCRQLHLPLQSGCDETLHRMGRRVTTREFARLVSIARSAIPDLSVTTDVIVGFPGEDEAAFRASYDFVAEMAFAQVHVFPYSSRPRTPAAKLRGRVSRQVRSARARKMRALGARLSSRFERRFLERDMDVLWEHRRPNGTWPGLTDNYLRVVTRAEDDLFNRITTTRLLNVQGRHIIGEVVA